MNLRLLGFFLVVGVVLASWFLTFAAWQTDRVTAGVVPLDPRSFEDLTLLTLGTGGAYENPNRLGPALAVALGEEVLLVDAGRSVAETLRAAKLPVTQPGTVYLSSLLPENTVGLDDLLLTGWLQGRETPLRVVGPAGTRVLTDGLAAAHAAAIRARAEALGLPADGARFEALDVGADFSEVRGGIGVRAALLDGAPLPTLAWRFEASGRVLVAAPVGPAPAALAEFSRGAQLLVHEAAYIPPPDLAAEIGLDVDPERLEREARLHSSMEDAGRLAQQSGVETLVLVRLRPPPVYAIQITGIVGDHFGGRILIPDDGDEIRP